MAKKNKLHNIANIELTKEMVELVSDRTNPHFEDYLDSIKRQNTPPFKRFSQKRFDIKDLMFACYIQGLKDAFETMEKGGVSIDDINLDCDPK